MKITEVKVTNESIIVYYDYIHHNGRKSKRFPRREHTGGGYYLLDTEAIDAISEHLKNS